MTQTSTSINPLLTIQAMMEEVKNTQSLYVINYTDRIPSNEGKRGEFIFVVFDESGEEVTIKLPNTWLPQDLSKFCDVNILFKSTIFRNIVMDKRALMVISAKQAQTLLAMPEAKKELNKIESQKNTLANEQRLLMNSTATVKPVNGRLPGMSAEDEIASSNTYAPTQSDMRLNNILSRLRNGQIGEDAALEEMYQIQPRPTDEGCKRAASDFNPPARIQVELAKWISGEDISVPEPSNTGMNVDGSLGLNF